MPDNFTIFEDIQRLNPGFEDIQRLNPDARNTSEGTSPRGPLLQRHTVQMH